MTDFNPWRPMTDEENATVLKYLKDLAEDRCPRCGSAVLTMKQIGRCVYGEPCGHRLYQGKVPPGKR